MLDMLQVVIGSTVDKWNMRIAVTGVGLLPTAKNESKVNSDVGRLSMTKQRSLGFRLALALRGLFLNKLVAPLLLCSGLL